MSLKIIYLVQSPNHIRIFESFEPQKDLAQVIATNNFTHNFKLGHSIRISLHNIIKHKPDVLVVSDSIGLPALLEVKKQGIKVVFILHGEWGPTTNNKGNNKILEYQAIDMFCSGMAQTKELYAHDPIFQSKFVSDALPQYDSLYQAVKDKDANRARIVKAYKIDPATKIITFFGQCKGNKGGLPHIEPFYKACVDLGKLVNKYGWLGIIKLKNQDVFDLLRKGNFSWKRKYLNNFLALRNNKNIRFVNFNENPYKYFASDAIITCSRSTVEIEGALASVPMVKVIPDIDLSGDIDKDPDLYGSMTYGSAYISKNSDEFEESLVKAVSGSNSELIKRQNEYVRHLGITFDGRAYLRVVDAIKK